MILMNRITICIFTLLLIGCGFHLRGQANLPPQLHHIAIASNTPYSLLASQLRQTLQNMHIAINENPNTAPLTIKLLTDDFNQAATGTGATNQLTNYTLTYTVTYQLLEQHGEALTEPRQIVVNRSFTANNNQMLGSSNEQVLLQQDMRRDAILQILNQLNSKTVLTAITKN